MKKIFLFAATALALGACSNDETTEVNLGNAIEFTTTVGGQTRATDKLAFANGDVFNVWATYGNNGDPQNYFKQDYEFNGTDWRSTATPYYWPATVDGTNNTMTFDAIWPASISRTVYGTFNYTVVDNAAAQEDVLYAKHVSTTKETTGVPLNFRHTLSQIIVKAKNSSSTLKFVVTGVQVAFVNKAGTFTYIADNTDTKDAANFAQNCWVKTDGDASAASAYTQTLTSATIAANAAATALGKSWILMPQAQSIAAAYTGDAADAAMAGAYLAVKMEIQNATDGTVIAADQWCCFPIAIDWNPGYKYTYTIDLAGGGYKEKNDGTDTTETTDLDPVLENQEIFFVDCTIDAWDESDANVTAPVIP